MLCSIAFAKTIRKLNGIRYKNQTDWIGYVHLIYLGVFRYSKPIGTFDSWIFESEFLEFSLEWKCWSKTSINRPTIDVMLFSSLKWKYFYFKGRCTSIETIESRCFWTIQNQFISILETNTSYTHSLARSLAHISHGRQKLKSTNQNGKSLVQMSKMLENFLESVGIECWINADCVAP